MLEAFQLKKSIAKVKCNNSIPCEFASHYQLSNQRFRSVQPELRITMASTFEEHRSFINYNFSSLLAESGGILGLFLGWSILSMISYLISHLHLKSFESLLTEIVTSCLIVGFIIWSKDLFQMYFNEAETFEIQVQQGFTPPFVTLCPKVSLIWQYDSLPPW